MINIKITKPNNTELIEGDFKKMDDAVKYVNNTLFSGIQIITYSILYNMMSRPAQVSKTYYDYIKVQKV